MTSTVPYQVKFTSYAFGDGITKRIDGHVEHLGEIFDLSISFDYPSWRMRLEARDGGAGMSCDLYLEYGAYDSGQLFVEVNEAVGNYLPHLVSKRPDVVAITFDRQSRSEGYTCLDGRMRMGDREVKFYLGVNFDSGSMHLLFQHKSKIWRPAENLPAFTASDYLSRALIKWMGENAEQIFESSEKG